MSIMIFSAMTLIKSCDTLSACVLSQLWNHAILTTLGKLTFGPVREASTTSKGEYLIQ